jgi:hypothetical protein
VSTTLDLEEIRERNRRCTETAVRVMLLRETPSEAEGSAFGMLLIESLKDVATLGAEIEKLRSSRQKVRDIHVPQASSDPSIPGAICTGCSVHGVMVVWPCATWKAMEDLVTETPEDAAILDVMEVHVRFRQEWGKPPRFMFIEKPPGEPPSLRPELTIPRELWTFSDTPGECLRLIAAAWTSPMALPVVGALAPPALYGVAFASSAWMTVDGGATAKAYAAERRLRDHPQRVRSCQIAAVVLGGRKYWAGIEHDSGRVLRITAGPDEDTGDVHDALAEVLAAATGQAVAR